MNDKKNLERLLKNPHYKMSEKQKAQLRALGVQHATSIPRHNVDIPKHPQQPPKEKEGERE